MTRRSFLAAPALLSAAEAPSDRIRMGAIGGGPRGRYVLDNFLKEKDVEVVAVCDCFADRRAAAKQAVDKYYGTSDCKAYRFHEQILERRDIDAVLIATGDRWHSVLSILAARAGKDVYCEKPFSLTIAEGRALVDTMKRATEPSGSAGRSASRSPVMALWWTRCGKEESENCTPLRLRSVPNRGDPTVCRYRNPSPIRTFWTTIEGWGKLRGRPIRAFACSTGG